jgi:tripartite-type tricarboxylate transporter receptor subunit TctC
VVPYSPGGGYDVYARMIAPYLEEQLGTTVVVENQPGAGGLLAVNNLLTKDPDGTSIALMNGQGSGAASIAGAPGATFALDDFSYLGRVAGEPPVVVTNGTGPHQTWDDVLAARGFRWAATGPGAEDYINPSVLTAVFELDAEVVSGFAGSSESELAVLQGSVDGMTGEPSSRRPAIENGSQTPVLVIGREAPEWVPEDVPLVTDVEMTEEQRTFIDAQVSLMEIGRPLIAPPGMDEGLKGCFRDAVAAALEDPELIAESEKQQRPINFLSGEDVDGLVTEILASPAEYKKLLSSMF